MVMCLEQGVPGSELIASLGHHMSTESLHSEDGRSHLVNACAATALWNAAVDSMKGVARSGSHCAAGHTSRQACITFSKLQYTLPILLHVLLLSKASVACQGQCKVKQSTRCECPADMAACKVSAPSS